MSDIRIAEDRPRNISYIEGQFEVSIGFGWAAPGNIPTSVKVSIRESARNTNLAASSDAIKKSWTTFEEAETEGRRVATELITTRSPARKLTGVGSSQVIHSESNVHK